MSHITTDDGVRLYVEQSGEGTPIIFVHEFA
ncbi:MAG: alpha/beta hydrolase, partial [Pseudomonadota bacterium]|nr:alpha/beta hydrolase [Pseudomonadota bacterium]